VKPAGIPFHKGTIGKAVPGTASIVRLGVFSAKYSWESALVIALSGEVLARFRQPPCP